MNDGIVYSINFVMEWRFHHLMKLPFPKKYAFPFYSAYQIYFSSIFILFHLFHLTKDTLDLQMMHHFQAQESSGKWIKGYFPRPFPICHSLLERNANIKGLFLSFSTVLAAPFSGLARSKGNIPESWPVKVNKHMKMTGNQKYPQFWF